MIVISSEEVDYTVAPDCCGSRRSLGLEPVGSTRAHDVERRCMDGVYVGGTPCLSLPPSFQEVLGLLNARQLDGSRK